MPYTKGSLVFGSDILDQKQKRLYVVLGNNPNKKDSRYIGAAVMNTRNSISIKIKNSDLINGEINNYLYVYPWMVAKFKEKNTANKKGKLKNQLTKKIIVETEKHIGLSLN